MQAPIHPSDAPVIQARDAGRWYGEVVGLNDLTVDFRPGITGLLGPNGAGKSTFMRMIVGELRPSRGSVRVLGLDPFGQSRPLQAPGLCPSARRVVRSDDGPAIRAPPPAHGRV